MTTTCVTKLAVTAPAFVGHQQVSELSGVKRIFQEIAGRSNSIAHQPMFLNAGNIIESLHVGFLFGLIIPPTQDTIDPTALRSGVLISGTDRTTYIILRTG